MGTKFLRGKLRHITMRGAVRRFGGLRGFMNFLPGGTLASQLIDQYAGDPHVNRHIRKAKKGHHVSIAKGRFKSKKHGGAHHAETALGLPPIDLSGVAQTAANLTGVGGLMEAAHAGAHGGGGGHRRHMNVGNVHALRRSMRRVEGFAKLAHRTMSFIHHHKLKTRRKGKR